MKSMKLLLLALILILLSLSVFALTAEEEALVGKTFTYEPASGPTIAYKYCPVVDAANNCPKASSTSWVVATTNEEALPGPGGRWQYVLDDLNEKLKAELVAPGLLTKQKTPTKHVVLREGPLCYHARRANTYPSNNCFELIPDARSLIDQFKKLTYPAVYEGSIDNKIAAQALYDQALGFKKIAELKMEWEGVPPALLKPLKPLAVIETITNQGDFQVVWEEGTDRLSFTFLENEDENIFYRLKYGDQVVDLLVLPTDKSGGFVRYSITGSDLREAGTPVDDMLAFSDFVIERGTREPKQVLATYKLRDVFNIDPLEKGLELDVNDRIKNLRFAYFLGKRLEISFVPLDPAALERNTYTLLVGNKRYDLSKELKMGVGGKVGASLDLSRPEYENVKELFVLDDDFVFFSELEIKAQDKSDKVEPAEVFYDYIRVLGKEGVVLITQAEQITTAEEIAEEKAVTTIFDFSDPSEFIPAVQAACGTSEQELNSRASLAQSNIQSKAQRKIKEYITGASSDPNMQVTLAGIMAAESRANPDVGASSAAAVGLMQFIKSTAKGMVVPYKSSYGSRCANADAASSKKCNLCLPACPSGGDARKEHDIAIAAAEKLMRDNRRWVKGCFDKAAQGKNVVLSDAELHKLTVAAYNAGGSNVCRGIETTLDGFTKSQLTWNDVAASGLSADGFRETRCYVPAVLFYTAYLADPIFGVESITGEGALAVTGDVCKRDCGGGFIYGVVNACDRDECTNIGKEYGVSCIFIPESGFIRSALGHGECRRGVGGDVFVRNQQNAQILLREGITFVSGGSCLTEVGERANARLNLLEMSRGESLTLCEAGCGGRKVCKKKEGFTLNPRILQSFVTLSEDFRFTVTSLATGAHSATSYHYKGEAFDIVPQPQSVENYKKLRDRLRELNPGESIFCESPSGDNVESCSGVDHIHGRITSKFGAGGSEESPVEVSGTIVELEELSVVVGNAYYIIDDGGSLYIERIPGVAEAPIEGELYIRKSRGIFVSDTTAESMTVVYFETDAQTRPTVIEEVVIPHGHSLILSKFEISYFEPGIITIQEITA